MVRSLDRCASPGQWWCDESTPGRVNRRGLRKPLAWLDGNHHGGSASHRLPPTGRVLRPRVRVFRQGLPHVHIYNLEEGLQRGLFNGASTFKLESEADMNILKKLVAVAMSACLGFGALTASFARTNEGTTVTELPEVCVGNICVTRTITMTLAYDENGNPVVTYSYSDAFRVRTLGIIR